MTNYKKYDVAIIGGGISGLIAGNYIAKSNHKVIIFEQHYSLGGCCSFFRRNGYTFEAGAHSLGSCRPTDGYLYKILNELNIYDELEIQRADCSDTVITKNYSINFSHNWDEAVDRLSEVFKKDKSKIYNFFKEVNGFNSKTFTKYYSTYYNFTFDDFLSKFSIPHETKEILSVFLGNLGVSSTQIAAISALALYKEFVLDGGYYVKGGMQNLVRVLKKKFEENGGVTSLKDKVIKINIENMRITSLETERSGHIDVGFVISTTGLRQTFLQLINKGLLPKHFVDKITKLKTSVSSLILHVGMKGEETRKLKCGRTIWYMPNLNVNEIYKNVTKGRCDDNADVSVIALPSKYDESLSPKGYESLMCMSLAPYKDDVFWQENKEKYKNVLLSRIFEIIPGIKNKIELSELATPPTIYRYTLNDSGALYGLAATKDQIAINTMPQTTPIENLLLSSHWVTQGYSQGGVPLVALAGKKAAKLINKMIKKTLDCNTL